jgi:hypothetical protein
LQGLFWGQDCPAQIPRAQCGILPPVALTAQFLEYGLNSILEQIGVFSALPTIPRLF